MHRFVLIEQIHLNVFVPRSLPAQQARGIVRVFAGQTMRRKVRKAISLVFAGHPALDGIVLRISK